MNNTENRKYGFGHILWMSGRDDVEGSELRGERPWIVVSNEHLNAGGVFVCVPLSCSNKKGLPTHVKIASSGRPCVALCEQPQTLSIDRVLTDRCVRKVSKSESEALHYALSRVFEFEANDNGPFDEEMAQLKKENAALRAALKAML